MLLESKHLAMLNCIKYVVFFMQHGFQPNASTNVQMKKQKCFHQWWRNNWLCWEYFEIYCWPSLLYLHKGYLSVSFTSDFPTYRIILKIYSVLKSNSNLHSTLRMDRKVTISLAQMKGSVKQVKDIWSHYTKGHLHKWNELT